MSDWSFARVWDGIAATTPEREALVCGPIRRTFGDFEERAAHLAGFLAAHGHGLHPGDKIAIDLHNRSEYLETFYAALKLGCVPVNVNYRYGVDETRYVLDDADARAIVHEPELASTVAEAMPGILALERGGTYDDAIARAEPFRAREPRGDDLVFLYTGGSTGMPKGVMWRGDDLYVALWQMGRPGTEPPDPIGAVNAGKRVGTALPACPLMHGTGLFIALSTLSGGGTVVLVDRASLDADRVWDEVERNDVAVLTIVGDAFARPLLAALDAHPSRWDLSCLRAITSSGVTWSPSTKKELLHHLPHLTLLDSLGTSEGMMTRSEARAGAEIAPARFAANERVQVLRETDGQPVTPGSGEVGLLAVGGRIPIGYYKDVEKTAHTFREVDGRRYSVAGDYATVESDGSITLLGRGTACINTGGEKVYPEEVELVLRAHERVFDCVVVGVDDDRFGELVVALVEANADAAAPTEDELRAHCRARLAGYKAPKRVLVVDSLQRAANGKADYKRLRAMAAELVAANNIPSR